MNVKHMPFTQEYLRSVFSYDEKTGLLHRIKGGNSRYTGTPGKSGYLWRGVKMKKYAVHRLIYLYVHGVQPEQIDHVDGDPANNRIENLRACTSAQNQFNIPRQKNNTTGFRGVYRIKIKTCNPYVASIKIKGKQTHLGCFPTAEEAAERYRKAALAYAGEFVRR